MREDRRRHLEEKIRYHECDVNCRTERTRSPHTLICTKNQSSYQEMLKTYHKDQESLATVVAIQQSLPSATESGSRKKPSKPKVK